jgi:high-affinity K+ transport system ATPase subunit B
MSLGLQAKSHRIHRHSGSRRRNIIGVAIMITGDSMLTGSCIAKESGMIKPNQSVIHSWK